MEPLVLVVDDSAVIRAAVSRVLREGGFRVELARDGQEGLERVEELVAAGDRPALVLTDINMPVMDGLALIRALKSGPHRFLPVLVLTSESQESLRREGMRAGAAGWVLKPFEPEKLLRLVRRLARPPARRGG